MKKFIALLLPVILFALTVSSVRAQEYPNALYLKTDVEEVILGGEITVTVGVKAPEEAITGIESYINYDPDIFEPVGGGPECNSSDYVDITQGDWFIEGCITQDVSGGETYLTNSKSILFDQTAMVC